MALLSGLRIQRSWLWLWCWPVATAPILPLAWELQYAASVAPQKQKNNKVEKKKKKTFKLFLLNLKDYPWKVLRLQAPDIPAPAPMIRGER